MKDRARPSCSKNRWSARPPVTVTLLLGGIERTCAACRICLSAVSSKPANSLDFTPQVEVEISVEVAISWLRRRPLRSVTEILQFRERASCRQVRSTDGLSGWRRESQRGGQSKAQRRLRRNFNLLVSGKRSSYESGGGTHERTNACSRSSSCQATDQRTSGRSSTRGSGSALTFALNCATQHIAVDLIGQSLG